MTGPSFDFPPSRRARKADPPLHLPLNRLTTSHRAGRTALFCARLGRCFGGKLSLQPFRSRPRTPRAEKALKTAQHLHLTPRLCLCSSPADLVPVQRPKTARHHVRSLDSFWSTRSHRAKRALVLAHAQLVMRPLRCCTASPPKVPPPRHVQCRSPTLSCAPLSHDPLARPKRFAPVRLPSRKTPYLLGGKPSSFRCTSGPQLFVDLLPALALKTLFVSLRETSSRPSVLKDSLANN